MENSGFGAILLKGVTLCEKQFYSFYTHIRALFEPVLYCLRFATVVKGKNYSANYANSFKTCKILHFQLVTLNNKFVAVRNGSGAGQ